ncbi:hypothetical protein M885DRAFT_619158 [Pelagophyceae sp. CCMP2097]|nr:hypothetical protein M885DRAFT_619158 [Pelagophyceae sp. CCMP2097]
MQAEAACTAAWLAVALPATLFICTRAWRRAAYAAFDEEVCVDAGLVMAVAVFAHVAFPVAVALASQDNRFVDILRFPALTAAECEFFVGEAEFFAASHGGWSTARHASYPTTDIAVQDLRFGKALYGSVEDRIFPTIAKWYLPEDASLPSPLRLRDLFIVKYDATVEGRQVALRKHRDGAELSFGVALSRGSTNHTLYAAFDHALQAVSVGEAWTQPSLAVHRARRTTEGKRYVLIGFVNVNLPWYETYWRRWGSISPELREWRRGDALPEGSEAQPEGIEVQPEARQGAWLLAARKAVRGGTLKLLKRRCHSVVKDVRKTGAPWARGLLNFCFALVLLLFVVLAKLFVDLARFFAFGTGPLASDEDEDEDADDRQHRKYR